MKFNELNEKAQQTAIDKYREKNDDLLLMFQEDAREQIKDAGFEEAELSYSLSYCQGDGLSFSAKRYSKLAELYEKVLGEGKKTTAYVLASNTAQHLKGNTSRYSYSLETDVELAVENYTSSYITKDRIDEVCKKVEAELREIYIDLCRKLENDGYKQLEYENSDEYIKETIEANDHWEYDEDGLRE